MGRHWRALGARTVSVARDADKAAAIAEITGLTAATVQRRLDEAHGKTLVANLFQDEWPTVGEDVDDLGRMGGMTAAAAREQGLSATIGKLLGVTRATISRRLAMAHGKTLVANVFEDLWPRDELEVNVEELGGMSAVDARDSTMVAAIAAVTGLTEPTVARRLDEAHGRTLVANVFEDEWPSPGDESEVDTEALGSMTTSEARDRELVPTIAGVTGLSESTVRRRLEQGHGKTLLANLFDDAWPGRDEEYEENVDDLGGRTATEAREHDLAAAVAEVVGLPIAVVQERLNEAHGKMLLVNVFKEEWPGEDPSDKRVVVSPGQGGDEHRLLQSAIADLGVVRNHHACTDKQLYAGFRPDVAWFRHDPSLGDGSQRPFHVFEIERGGHGALAKSVQSLQLAHDKFNADITLVVRAASLVRAKEMVAAHFGQRLRLCTVERCLDAAAINLARLAEELGVQIGTRR